MSWVHAEHLGFLPMILLPESRMPVMAQLNARYAHGGGYMPLPNEDEFTVNIDRNDPGASQLQYPGDPVFKPWGWCWFPFTSELVVVFDAALTVILQEDGSYNIVRLD